MDIKRVDIADFVIGEFETGIVVFDSDHVFYLFFYFIFGHSSRPVLYNTVHRKRISHISAKKSKIFLQAKVTESGKPIPSLQQVIYMGPWLNIIAPKYFFNTTVSP